MVDHNIRIVIRDMIRPLGQALRRIIGRAKVTRISAAAANRIQRFQVIGLGGNPRQDIEHAEPYGLAAHPLPGAEAWIVANAGDQAQLVALVVGDPRHHPLVLQPGEVCLYSMHGQRVHLKADGGIDIDAPGDINMAGENVTVEARKDLRLRGENIFRYAAVEDQEDVAGYARGLRHEGGTTWTDRTWTDGATVESEENDIQPPEVTPVDEGGED